jgi:integral membrane protein
VQSALKPFRIMAYLVGVMLLILVAEMILKYGFDNPLLGPVVAQIHGFLYVVYLLAALNLGLKARWSAPYLVGVLLAGTIPFLSFYVESKVTQRVQRESAVTGTA